MVNGSYQVLFKFIYWSIGNPVGKLGNAKTIQFQSSEAETFGRLKECGTNMTKTFMLNFSTNLMARINEGE